ncbi:MAG: ABC transporter substrate-binding protein [Candidatus Bathyarchaeota archaeon]|nr:ABC transporter substrate-binding protein [Candidatus Bathyarchaeota archaeon]
MRPHDWRLWAVLAVVLVVGGGIILVRRPSQENPEDEAQDVTTSTLEGTIRIGVVVSEWSEMPAYELLTPLAQDDINEYCVENGLNCSFEFEIASGEGTAATALQRTQDFKAQGIDLVMGYGWSSHICATINYVTFNGMVQLSPASTSSTCAEDDSNIRLCPHDSKQSVPLARLIRSWSVSDVVILQRKDSWGDGVSEWFRERFEEEGGRIAATITYPGEITGESFAPILEEVNASLSNTIEERDPGNVALLLLSFEEASQILNMSRDYQAMAEVSWFGSEETVTTQLIMEEAGSEAAAVGLFSPFPAVTRNELYERVNAAFEAGLGYELGFYDANIYDCCWILALSAIEAGTDDGDVVRTVLPEVASNYSGMSGPCTLDAYGDRDAVDYDIWGYIEEESCNSVKFGRYDCESDQVELYRSPLHPLEDIVTGEGTVYVGAVGCYDDDYAELEFLVGTAERDINAYCDLTGAPVRFRFLPYSAGG